MPRRRARHGTQTTNHRTSPIAHHRRPPCPARRLLRAAGVLPTLGLLLAGCGDSGSNGTQAFGARAAPGVSISAHLTVGGTITLDATWTDDISDAAIAASCADAAKGVVQDGVRYFLPRAPSSTSFSGHVLGILGVVAGYHGPGGYDAPAVLGADGTSTIFAIDGAGWAAVNGGTAHVDVKPDDSGMLVYQKLAPTPPTPPPTINGPASSPAPARTGSITGVLTWTCVGVRSTATNPPSPTPAPPTPARKATPTPTPHH